MRAGKARERDGRSSSEASRGRACAAGQPRLDATSSTMSLQVKVEAARRTRSRPESEDTAPLLKADVLQRYESVPTIRRMDADAASGPARPTLSIFTH